MNTQNKTTTASAQPENVRISKAYIRHYSDNGQTTAYIEWADGSRTEGEPENGHMLALMQRAVNSGLNITRETW